MKVYIAHSRAHDYQKEIYDPIRQNIELPDTEIILPHEPGHNEKNGREFYDSLDLMIAEVSYPATGLGIELGWAFDSSTPIVCIHKTDAELSGSLRAVTDHFYQYDSIEELINLIKTLCLEYKNVH